LAGAMRLFHVDVPLAALVSPLQPKRQRVAP